MAEVFTPLTTSNLNGSISSITSAVDSNFSILKTLLNDILSRSGMFPNTMTSSLDMNSNRILNLSAPGSLLEPVRLGDLTVGVGAAGPQGATGATGATGPAGPPGTLTSASSVVLGTIELTGNIGYTNSTSGPANGGGFWSGIGEGNGPTVTGTSADSGFAAFNNLIYYDSMSIAGKSAIGYNFVLSTGGAATQGSRTGLQSNFYLTSSPGDTNGQYSALNTISQAACSAGGTAGTGNGKGTIFGSNPYARLISGATNWAQLIGTEIDVSVRAGASVDECIGLQIVQDSLFTAIPNRTSSICFSANNQATPGSVSGWDYLMADGCYAGYPSLKSTGTLLGCYLHNNVGTKPTIANAIDLNNYNSITGYILRGPGANGYIDGNFNVSVGSIKSSGFPVNFGVLYNSGGTSPAAAGTGYVVGDLITLTGGTFTTAAILSVVSVSSGAITQYQVVNPGRYTVLPANPAGQGSTTGFGTGATFTLSWGLIAATLDLQSLGQGDGNLFLGGTQNPGISALYELAGGYCVGAESTFIGCRAGSYVTTGTFNTAVGHNAIGNGSATPVTGSNNVAVGTDSMRNLISSANNISIGVAALRTSIAANFNVAIGTQALQGIATSTPSSNVVIGYSAGIGAAMTNTRNNVLIGANTGLAITSCQNSVFLGMNTGQKITSGSQNILIGQGVGSTTLITGSNNILIGTANNTDTTASGTNDTLVIGCSSGSIPWLTGHLVAASPYAQFGGPVGTVPYTVSTLPVASVTYTGMSAYVTDATSPTYLGTLTGGGSVVCRVFCNGSAWVSA